ncbi:hypothetical protein [Streptomyces agglomeratus]|nr:hypothetical protein [Streptomyces agglomeratus]
MSDGFAGDPFHEGGSQPMEHLKGGMEQPHTQQPMQGSNDTNSNQHDSPAAGWNTTSLGSKPSPTGSNDARKAH